MHLGCIERTLSGTVLWTTVGSTATLELHSIAHNS